MRYFVLCFVCLAVAAPAEAGGGRYKESNFVAFQNALLTAVGRSQSTKPNEGSTEDALHRSAFLQHHGRSLHPAVSLRIVQGNRGPQANVNGP